MSDRTMHVSATQKFNHTLFGIRVPAYAVVKADIEFEPVTTEVYYDQGVKITSTCTDPLGFLPRSFYQFDSPESRITTSLTIPRIMRLWEDKVDITVVTPVDTIDIFCTVNDYLNEVKDNVFNKEVEYTDYVKRVIPFRQEMYFHFRWAIQKNPEWRDFFNRNYHNNVGAGIRALVGAKRDDDFNGITRLQKPPYTVEEVEALFAAPKSDVQASGEHSNRISIQDYIGGNKGVVRARDPFRRFSDEEGDGANIASDYL